MHLASLRESRRISASMSMRSCAGTLNVGLEPAPVRRRTRRLRPQSLIRVPTTMRTRWRPLRQVQVGHSTFSPIRKNKEA